MARVKNLGLGLKLFSYIKSLEALDFLACVNIIMQPTKTASVLVQPIIFRKMERYREQYDPSDPLAAIMADNKLMNNMIDINNPWINTTLKTWQKEIKLRDVEHTLKILRWCAYDTDFSPNNLDSSFGSKGGLLLITHLSVKEHLRALNRCSKNMGCSSKICIGISKLDVTSKKI